LKTVYALQPIPKSIFLAGPTPRDEETPTWRPEALAILKSLGFDGTVFVPESEDWKKHDRYEDQVEWEWRALERAGVIAFWVPRDLTPNGEGSARMPAFTTNVEFGLHASSGKCLLGYPRGAAKMTYLDRLARERNIPVYGTLDDLLRAAVDRAG